MAQPASRPQNRKVPAFELLVLGIPVVAGAALTIPVLFVTVTLLALRTIVRRRLPWILAVVLSGLFLGFWAWRLQVVGATIEGLKAQYLTAHLGLLVALRDAAVSAATPGTRGWTPALDGVWFQSYIRAVAPLAVPAGVVLATTVHLIWGPTWSLTWGLTRESEQRLGDEPPASQGSREAPEVLPQVVVRPVAPVNISAPADRTADDRNPKPGYVRASPGAIRRARGRAVVAASSSARPSRAIPRRRKVPPL